MTKNNMNHELLEKIDQLKTSSHWSKAIQQDAYTLVESCEQKLTLNNFKEALLNGAENWNDYSYSGNGLVYDGDIADHYCTPSELKKTKGGALQPNKNENWLDVQARALYQAERLIKRTLKQLQYIQKFQ